jgi:hypothetical protein
MRGFHVIFSKNRWVTRSALLWRAYRRTDSFDRRRAIIQAWADFCCGKPVGRRVSARHLGSNTSYAAQLPSKQAREDYLRERRRELVTGAQAEGATPRDAAIVADACVDAARRITTELLALRAGAPQGRA